MKYITVLDFVDGRVYQYKLNYVGPELEGEDFEEYITNKGHSLNNCEWMIHENPQVITK